MKKYVTTVYNDNEKSWFAKVIASLTVSTLKSILKSESEWNNFYKVHN